ncbi:MAG: ATP-binding cassette domain-containing protein [Proteobacteria bacterium]|nr:ATP-binding cassette domain-containing protein [Pseudomonadota bacterium]
MTESNTESALLEVRDLKVHFPVHEGVLIQRQVGSVKAVDGVSFTLQRGETFGLVGESGCGKSTTALAVLKMVNVSGGQIIFEGQDIATLNESAMHPLRKRMQMVYQDPFGSLNPRMKVGDIIGEPLVVHGVSRRSSEYKQRVRQLIDQVGLLPDMAGRYPHEFSGGQRQRIGIARALALNPALLICDEPVSALDVSIQAQVVNLLMDLQRDLNLTVLFIAHDLSVVRHISDRIGVMYLGKIVEIAPRDELFDHPRHPYTRALLDAVPVPNPIIEAGRAQQLIRGEVPSVRNPPAGCHFQPRCPLADSRCREQRPVLTSHGLASVACHNV